MIFATAGMRLVESDKAHAVWESLKNQLLANDYPFLRGGLQAKTISGREEGVFAFLAANYLTQPQRIGVDLKVQSESLMGVLDLGGSSTQIAVPPSVKVGDSIQPHLQEKHMYVKSFLSLGMERMRQNTLDATLEQAHWVQRVASKVPNPCGFS